MDKEPAAIVGFITALVGALLSFLQEFGVDLTDGQQNAIRGLVAILAPLVAAFVIRGLVWSPESVKEKVAEAHQDGLQGTAQPPKVV